MGAARGDGPAGPAPVLGAVLRRRAPEIVEHVVGVWRESGIVGTQREPTEWDAIETSVRDSTLAGTLAVADYLESGVSASRTRTEQWDWSGEAALNGMISLSVLTKLFLDWRRTCVDVVRDAARSASTSFDELDAAVDAVRGGSDTSIVRMAKRFEATRREVAEQLADSQGLLEHQALHDPLTGLANRVLLLDRLARALDGARHSGLAVLFLDLDAFKMVNDVSGHAVGDDLLVEVGARLHSVLRPTDTVARLGGDEFVVVCEDMAEPLPEALAIADRLLGVLRHQPGAAGSETVVGASIGVALAEPGEDAETLLERADQAMLRAKRLGRGRVEVYDATLDDQANQHAAVVEAMRRALGDEELAVAYRPVRSLPDRRLVVREAVVRWRHGETGQTTLPAPVPPTRHGGGVREVGDWVLRQACEECARWRAAGEPDVGVAVNVSSLEFEAIRFADEVEGVLTSMDLAPEALTIEISEPLLTVDGTAALVGVERLHRLGVRIAVDDFGTGQCSLTRLARLPVDLVKIDESLTDVVGTAGREAQVVEAMIRSAHTLGLTVVAKGVETAEQLERLTALGCDHAQGLFLGDAATLHTATPGTSWDPTRHVTGPPLGS